MGGHACTDTTGTTGTHAHYTLIMNIILLTDWLDTNTHTGSVAVMLHNISRTRGWPTQSQLVLYRRARALSLVALGVLLSLTLLLNAPNHCNCKCIFFRSPSSIAFDTMFSLANILLKLTFCLLPQQRITNIRSHLRVPYCTRSFVSPPLRQC